MTHTSGLASGGAGATEAACIALRRSSDNLAEYIPTLGAAPLDFQNAVMQAIIDQPFVESVGQGLSLASQA